MGKKIRIKDIASKLGLSSTLVSLVLNNKADQQGIKRETQERVFAVAHQLGYFKQKEKGASEDSVEEKPGIVGIIVPSLSDPFIIDFVPYMQKALTSIGFGLTVMTKDPMDNRFLKMIPGIRKFFSGIVLVGDTADANTVRVLKNSDCPFIVLENCPGNMRLNIVRTDCEAGSILLSQHINNLGYKNITLVTRKQPMETVVNSISSIERSLSEIIPDSVINNAVVATIPGVNLIDTDLLSEYIRPPYHTEVFVVTEANLVYPIMQFFIDSKVRIPHDIALVSTEDGIGFDLMFTPITRIKKQIPELASKAAKMIWTEIKNSGKSKYRRSVNILPELIIGRSCGTIK
jgi:LacI family transcriptional regulator